ncbi:hypothetical protein NEUTE1DRAFT_122623 [Neurospora tetrasperma FGSC 2508]|uniref:Uncharacterized protein n=1 Tax=Neurospora tetrasperma (strain FGSC 2508 / ATCC MYA-4615 / P0657) TaxID=510951 RepID=F8MLM4_NEUT8|nr:uncharacterized protein NEUTE1DRAFT_122623 [Neurospora tetrasperma FGSC 2508]EGO58443.1 hypothetical protein NEUTE1DRAFT_122623 [Neurospora tetrasperma FGSC 2508]EGZ71222.1 hypothetical protein NEUTE2DRAFT_109675 [Neurospora tetrasperma FGSC 2509]
MAPVDHAGTLLVALVATAVIAQNTTVSNGLQDAVGWVNNPSQRGTLMLLLECLTTIFACTWTVLHLNFPIPADSKWTRFLRKVKWMFITILFPEFIFAKGICEFCFALHILHLMAEMMESHPEWFESSSTYTSPKLHEHIVTRRWKAAYSPWMQLLHKWVVLTLWPPNIAENNAEEDNNNDPPARRSSTSSTTRAGVSILQGSPEYEEIQYWTINHAYYANMGGLRGLRFTTNDALEYSILRGDHLATWDLRKWRQGHPLQELRLSAAEIDDKMSPLIPLAFTYFLSRLGTRRLSRHQIEARKETLTKLSSLQRLPDAWVQLLHFNIDDPSLRPVFGEDKYEDTRRKITEHVTSLLEFRTLLSNLEDEKNRQVNLLENIWNCMLQLKDTYESLDGKTWHQYEEQVTLVARTMGIPGLENHEPRVLKTLHECFLEVSLDKWSHRSQYQRSKRRLESGIGRYARYINIFFGTIYAISRVALVVLMFSSLREVPKGVYEVAGWTRFLPSFS